MDKFANLLPQNLLRIQSQLQTEGWNSLRPLTLHSLFAEAVHPPRTRQTRFLDSELDLSPTSDNFSVRPDTRDVTAVVPPRSTVPDFP